MMDPNGENMPQQLSSQQNQYFSRHLLRALIFFMMVTITCLAFYQSSTSPAQLLLKSISSFPSCHAKTCTDAGSEDLVVLDQVLKRASMDDKTVILTTLNEAWIEPDSIFDLFLKSFSIGNQTLGLLQHLVVVALDKKAYDYCSNTLHLNCYNLTTKDVDLSGEAHFMTPGYLKMMWRRIDFLRRVLEMGYNFVFTDADIMWLRNPLPHFYSDTDFQISCDYFKGDPSDVENAPNGGFNYVKSSKKTIKFYKFWYKSRQYYPGQHDQDVFNKIKYDPYVSDIGLKIKYLDTAYFGGFCEPSKDMNLVCTMHANCCAGLDNKIHDLNIVLEDWTNYLSLLENSEFIFKSYSKEEEWNQNEIKNAILDPGQILGIILQFFALQLPGVVAVSYDPQAAKMSSFYVKYVLMQYDRQSDLWVRDGRCFPKEKCSIFVHSFVRLFPNVYALLLSLMKIVISLSSASTEI